MEGELDKIRFIMFIKSFLESLFSYSLSAEFSATLEVLGERRRRRRVVGNKNMGRFNKALEVKPICSVTDESGVGIVLMYSA